MTRVLLTLSQAGQGSVITGTDPHGIIVSSISMAGVFLALLILTLTYIAIGKCISMTERRNAGTAPDRQDRDMAETNVITIKRKPTALISRKEDISRLSHIHRNEDDCTETPDCHIVKSPLPGIMTEVKVKVGDSVNIGDELAVLEAMKMENTIESEYDGTVAEIYVSERESILEGEAIVKII